MNRKSIAIAIILLISSLAPAAAVIGFCTRMPCCATESAGDAVAAMSRPDCCHSIRCAESPEQKLGATATIEKLVGALHAAPAATLVPGYVSPTIQSPIYHDPAPPLSNQERMSTLSLFLI